MITIWRMDRRVLPVVALSLLSACASRPGEPEFTVEAGGYAASFARAKDVLREYEFELERVDARAGVITTAPRPWAGGATPWIPHASTFGDAVEGLANDERRTVRVEFLAPGATGGHDDLRATDGEITGQVTVTVERIQRPGRRADPSGVRLHSFTTDPALDAKNESGPFITTTREDFALAARIARDIAREPGHAASR